MKLDDNLSCQKEGLVKFPNSGDWAKFREQLGRVEERTGYGQRWADHQASLYGFLTLPKSWMHGFQTQNHVYLYIFFIFQILTLSFPHEVAY